MFKKLRKVELIVEFIEDIVDARNFGIIEEVTALFSVFVCNNLTLELLSEGAEIKGKICFGILIHFQFNGTKPVLHLHNPSEQLKFFFNLK